MLATTLQLTKRVMTERLVEKVLVVAAVTLPHTVTVSAHVGPETGAWRWFRGLLHVVIFFVPKSPLANDLVCSAWEGLVSVFWIFGGVVRGQGLRVDLRAKSKDISSGSKREHHVAGC